jgi:hypothetical protein
VRTWPISPERVAFARETPIEVGVARFVAWYRDYIKGKFA